MPTAGGILGGASRITTGGNVGGGGGRCPTLFNIAMMYLKEIFTYECRVEEAAVVEVDELL